MSRSLSGPLVAGIIVLGVVAILYFNFQPDRPTATMTSRTAKPVIDDPAPPSQAGNVREYPIGDPVMRNHLQVAAVWMPGVTMEGMAPASAGSSDLIHLEADIRSLGDNPNGFARDEFIPYLKIAYEIQPASGGPAIDKGELSPMIASDGLHYGANIAMPRPGSYRLVYAIEPPSAGGLGRHVGVGGVAAWWEPFRAEFDWKVEPSASTSSSALAGAR